MTIVSSSISIVAIDFLLPQTPKATKFLIKIKNQITYLYILFNFLIDKNDAVKRNEIWLFYNMKHRLFFESK
ncbi:MAG TPA: hypothetical protein VJ697_10440 [Nitrososphaeraceae archaeon]|jgi:hypothetical protein|nr:hypothetical protein [Nitrososphaeraceae archaeon]